MKILVINDYSTAGGGAEILTLTLVDGLRGKGHDVRLFSSSVPTSAMEKKADYECFGTSSRLRTFSQAANFSAYRKLKSSLDEFKPDVVHVHMFMTQISPLILPLLRSIPTLYHVNLYEAICPLATKLLPQGDVCNVQAGWVCHQTGCIPFRAMPPQMLKIHLFRKWSSSFDIFIAASEAVKRFLDQENIHPVEVIPNGVPVTAPRQPLNGEPTVSFAGHLIPRKGVDVLLNAFARVVSFLPQAKLIIAGEGPEKDSLKMLTERLRITGNVTFPGFLSQTELEKQFARSWVHATPSIWEEPFGITSLEAMMRGTAVVASKVGGQRECIQDGVNGYLVRRDDAESLSAALLKILQNRELAENMGREGRAMALEQYSDSKYVDRFERVYQKLTTARKMP
jgi:glycosyltransferase involved in cell wall biosynthesis